MQQALLQRLAGAGVDVFLGEAWLHRRNPLHVIARILADLHGADGRVMIPGFYDGVPETPDAPCGTMKTIWLR